MHSKICFIYFVPFYVVPIFLYYFIGGHSNFIDFHLTPSYYLYIGLCCLSVMFFYKVFSKVSFLQLRLINIYRPTLVWLLLSFAVLPLAFYFKVSYGLTFRQTGENLSDSGAIPKLIFLIKPMLTAFVAYHFFAGDRQTSHVEITLFNILLFFSLTIASSFEALLILLLFLRVFFKKFFYKILITDSIPSGFKRIIVFFKLSLIGGGALSCIIFVGIANKVGFDESLEYFSNTTVTSKLGYYLYYRVSIYNSSLAIGVNSDYKVSDNVKTLEILQENIAYRIKIISGSKPIRPDVTNLNRYNYLKVHYLPKDKEIGASPGVFTTFLNLFSYPFGIVFCGAYLGWLVMILSRFRPPDHSKEYSWIAAVFIYYLMFTFLHSPINNIFTIGPEPVKFFLYLATFFLIASRNEDLNRYVQREK